MLLNVKLVNETITPLDIICFVLNIYILYLLGLYASIAFCISCNFFYGINVIGDHDTFESAVKNNYIGQDWLKLQVSNSSNFKTDSIICTTLFGSINYQIEHHLFPSMSNHYYKTISPMVKAFCEEHNVPYVAKESHYEVYTSFIKTLKHFNTK